MRRATVAAPFRHGAPLPPSATTLAERLRDAGYRTAAFVSSFVISRRFGFDQGFADFDDAFERSTSTFTPELWEGLQIEGGFDRRGDETTRRALRWLASSHAMVISSRMEGGANVVCEALRIGVPVLASRIPGNVGLLGRGYAGYFPVEDERALARLVMRAATEAGFYSVLAKQVRALRAMVAPRSEARALLRVIASRR